MTMPAERTRALRWAGEFLRELEASGRITDPAQLREIQTILRHYPSATEIRNEAQTSAKSSAPGRLTPWLAPEDDQH